MEKQQNTGKYWFWFFVWAVITLLMAIFIREYIWLAFPGLFTYFAKAMNLLDADGPENFEW